MYRTCSSNPMEDAVTPDETTPTRNGAKEREDDRWREGVKYYGEIARVINSVGLGTLIVIAGLWYAYKVSSGVWQFPFVAAGRYEQTYEVMRSDHIAIVETQKIVAEQQKLQTDLLSDGVDALKDIRCEVKSTEADTLACYRKQREDKNK